MDIRDISQVFVAKNCARTNGSDTIDGATVTGVQIYTSKEDDLSAAETFYGPGELVITDESGLVLTASTALKAIPAIKIHQRSHIGVNHFASSPILGSEITSYNLTKYKAPVELTSVIHTIDASLGGFLYMIKLRRRVSDTMHVTNGQEVRTITFKSATAGSTATEIATGLVAAINTQLNEDESFPCSAIVGGASSDAVIITALPLYWELDNFNYDKLRFSVEGLSFDATVESNEFEALTYNSITYDQATRGAGTYQQVVEMESFGKLFTGANKDKNSPEYQRNIVALDAQPYLADGVTPNTYDTLVVNFKHSEGAWSQNVNQQGSFIIFLPVEDNGTNQQSDIVNTLNKYIVTEYGVSTVKTLT